MSKMRLQFKIYMKTLKLLLSIILKVLYQYLCYIQTIPVTQGTWYIRVESNHAENSNYSVEAVTRYAR